MVEDTTENAANHTSCQKSGTGQGTSLYYSDITMSSYTKADFIYMLEKRLRKHLRQMDRMNLRSTYCIEHSSKNLPETCSDNDDSFTGSSDNSSDDSSGISSYNSSVRSLGGYAELLKTMLQSIFKNQLKFLSPSEKDEHTIPLQAKPLEMHIAEHLDVFFKGEDPSLLKSSVANPLKVLSQKECQQLASIFSITEGLPKFTNSLVERMQERYPQTKSSILKSIDELQRRLSDDEAMRK